MSNRPDAPTGGQGTSGEVFTVRPVRAAFGPTVSVVSVDADGRLWVRFSTALTVMIAGILLVSVPLLALWWVSADLLESGQVNLDRDKNTTFVPDRSPSNRPGVPTELPLADPDTTR